MDGWQPAVYILASQRNGTLYIGVTTNLHQRIYAHREGLLPGFTRDYCVKRLVHVEHFHDIRDAIDREKRLKKWRRAWKLKLIEEGNSGWRDLAEDLGYPPLEMRHATGSPLSRG